MSVQEGVRRGPYFEKREYRDKPLPEWLAVRLQLPAPQLPEAPAAIDAYWRAWELAFAHFRRPRLGSALVSNFLDPMAGGRLQLWDACAMASCCDLAHDLVPGIRALDNFYAAQHADGEICRELESDGQDVETWLNREGRPLFSRQTGRGPELGREAPVPDLTLDGVGHPALAWAERESYHQTGDAERVAAIWPALARYRAALARHLRHRDGLYVADWSLMDNSPRNPRLLFAVDGNCEQVLLLHCLAELGPVAARGYEGEGRFPEGLEARRLAREAAAEAEALSALIRARMWDAERRFFFDILADGSRSREATIAGFWALLAGVATPEQAEGLCGWLRDEATFGRACGVPALAATSPAYDPRGGFFRGGVWPALQLMVARGLSRYGYTALAREVALRHVLAAAAVCADTGTFFDNYAPDAPAPGRPARADCVGAGGVGPITLLLEFGVGLRANAPLDQLRWSVETVEPCGCDRYFFRGTRVKLLCDGRRSLADPLRVRVEAGRPLRLAVATGGRELEREVRGRVEFEV